MDRDLKPIVRIRSGFSACDYPVSLVRDGKTLTVNKIIKEWREPGSKFYLVETSDGSHFKLTFSEANSQWGAKEVRIKFNK